MKVVSLSYQRSGPGMQSYLLAKALNAFNGWEAVDISVADCYIKQPYTYGLWDLAEDQPKEVEEWITSADVFVIHNFDPHFEDIGPRGDRWRPTYPVVIPGYKELRIPLRRDNCVIKLHGTDCRVYGGFIHGYEYRHGHLFVGSPDPQLWSNAKCVSWIPPMMDKTEMDKAVQEYDLREDPDLKDPNDIQLHKEHGAIVVNHCATQRKTKGTSVLTDAIALLRERGVQAYADIVQGTTWAESLWHQSVCDVYFDQLGYYGCYGVSAIQALLLGKPVICELSPLVKSWLSGKSEYNPFMTFNEAVDAESIALQIQEGHKGEGGYPIHRKTFAEHVHGLGTVGEQWRWLLEGVCRK